MKVSFNIFICIPAVYFLNISIDIFQSFFVLFFQSSQNRLLIKNGKVVNEDSIVDSDIFIENGVIS